MFPTADDLLLSNSELCSDDAFLNGKLRLLQPSCSYKAGLDAVLLASTVTLEVSQMADILDCGAGVGTVGLCVAARCSGARVTLVERESLLCQVAQKNILRNGLQERAKVIKGDLTLSPHNKDAPALCAESFDYVLANPPYHRSEQSTGSKDNLKNVAHAMPAETLELWIKFAARITRPGGRFALIHKAAEYSDIMTLLKGKFGSIRIRPIYSNIDEPAIRILVEGCKGSKGQLQILPPLILHKPDKEFTTCVNRILREGFGLKEALAISKLEENL